MSTAYTFHYVQADETGAFRMSLDPRDNTGTEAEVIEAGSYQEASSKFDELYHDTRFVVGVSYPMSELEVSGKVLGDGWPV